MVTTFNFSILVPVSSAVTYELCAGIVDREDTVENIACSEVLEETGYKITPDMLEPIAKFRLVIYAFA